MKPVHYVVAAVTFGVAAALLLAGGLVERRIAAAQRALATLDVAEAERAYARIAGTVDYAVMMPGLFRGLRDDLATRRAAVRYWRSDYEALVAEHADTNDPDARMQPDLPFLLANAGYRAARDRVADRQDRVDTLTRAIAGYRRILENNPEHLDAAFNFEYLVRLREDIARGEDFPAGSLPDLHGREGAPPPEADLEEIQIYIPLEEETEPDDDGRPTIGQPIQKRG